MMLPSDISIMLPLACQWAVIQEKFVLENGKPLLLSSIDDAKRVGVNHPEKIRILGVSSIPVPTDPILQRACYELNFLGPDTVGLTLQYGIYIRNDAISDRGLNVHEFVHTSQYERFGGINNFLETYMKDLFQYGYHDSPLEQEAVQKTHELTQNIISE